ADGVVYGEVRWAPEQHTQAGLSLDEAVEAVTAGLNGPCKSSMDPYRYTKYCVRCDKIRPITPKRSPNSHIGTVRWVPWWLSTLPDQNSDFQPPILPTYLLGWTNDSCPSLFTPVKQTGSTR